MIMSTRNQIIQFGGYAKKVYMKLWTLLKLQRDTGSFHEISDIESQIEILKGQIKFMDESAALVFDLCHY
jgi:hypothetical protein